MTWQKGQSGNPNGRPPAGKTVVDNFRSNPKAEKVLAQVVTVAATLGRKNQHPDAMACAKIVADKLVPSMKVQEINMEPEGRRLGPVILPAPVPIIPAMDGNQQNKTLDSDSVLD
ncbi:DUF5681 domain-containing protein [Candidatus Neomarinimicrobiota bacterium]